MADTCTSFTARTLDFQRSSLLEYVPTLHRNTHGRIYLSRFKKPILFPSVIHSSTLLRNMWKSQTFAKSTGYVIRQTEREKKDAITLASTVAQESIWTLLETFSRRITCIIFYKNLSAYNSVTITLVKSGTDAKVYAVVARYLLQAYAW